jgi:hypothetical protein
VPTDSTTWADTDEVANTEANVTSVKQMLSEGLVIGLGGVVKAVYRGSI